MSKNSQIRFKKVSRLFPVVKGLLLERAENDEAVVLADEGKGHGSDSREQRRVEVQNVGLLKMRCLSVRCRWMHDSSAKNYHNNNLTTVNRFLST